MDAACDRGDIFARMPQHDGTAQMAGGATRTHTLTHTRRPALHARHNAASTHARHAQAPIFFGIHRRLITAWSCSGRVQLTSDLAAACSHLSTCERACAVSQ
eukprot:365048-Chlamydomonas_euryale.AAC.26